MLTKRQVWWIKIFSISPVIWFVLFFLYSFGILLPRTIKNQEKLEKELSYIVLPPQTSFQPLSVGEKVTFSWVTQDYLTSLKAQEIFDYYDSELTRNGWTFRKAEAVHPPDPWRSNGFCPYSCNRHYCKDGFEATVDFYDGGSYSLWLRSNEMLPCEDDKNLGTTVTEALFGIGCSTTWMLYAIAVGVALAKLDEKGFLSFAKQISWQSRDVSRTGIYALGAFILSLLIYYYCIMIISKYL